MSRFAELLNSLGVIRTERQRVERRLEDARRELASLRTASMCKTDTIAAMDSYIDACQAHFTENLLRAMRQFNRDGIESFDDVGGGLPLFRNVTNGVYDDRLATSVLAPQLKAQIRESLKGWKCPGTLPLAKRKARCAELETEVAQLSRELAEIEAATDAARGVL
jgi:DNA repair exonuclease SbcCD ATPase subunit